MKTKILEIRDSKTCIPALAIQMLADDEVQAYYVHEHCGYPRDGSSVVLMKLREFDDGEAKNDSCAWVGARTMPVAHNYVLDHFDELEDGDVVDVEFILGETEVKKTSERLPFVCEHEKHDDGEGPYCVEPSCKNYTPF